MVFLSPASSHVAQFNRHQQPRERKPRMFHRKFRNLGLIVLTMTVAGGLLTNHTALAASTTVSALASKTHFHGIAVDPSNSSRVYLATHHGLYVVSSDGAAVRISTMSDDFMGFTAHPTNSSTLYASGHPKGGGNLGFIVSKDSGQSWQKLSNGIGGPVDFHQMDVSKADPRVIYGVHRGLQRSNDGGRTWRKTASVPKGLIDLAASGKDVDTLYAATRGGLLKSIDAGRSWRIAHVTNRTATMVHVTRQGEVYAYLIGIGLVRTKDPGVNWQLVSNDVGRGYPLHLAADAATGRSLYAVTLDPKTRSQAFVVSRDGGKSWAALEKNK